MIDYNSIITRYYEPGSELYDILTRHSDCVCQLALKIAQERSLPLDLEQIEAGAMLHDIGIVLTDAPGICCYGSEPYIRHGILGAQMLRDNGCPEWLARIAERHTGAGITADEVIARQLPLPVADYTPETQLERLICYADKFYSKSRGTDPKPLDRVKASMSKFSPETLQRFEALHAEFALK